MIFNIFTQSSSKKKPPSPKKKAGLLDRLKQGLAKSRSLFQSSLSLLVGKKHIDKENKKQLYKALLLCDVGPTTTEYLIEEAEKLLQSGLTESVEAALNQALSDALSPSNTPWEMPKDRPCVILFVGVNGSGKTTTIGRLSHHLSKQGFTVGMAAGDTFRAAAIDQLKEWGKKTNSLVISQKQGSDSASVLFDGVQAAKTRSLDVLLGDTAGRLHNKTNLMQELAKVKKVVNKQIPEAPHETWLVVDGSVGQNGLKQALEFKKSVDITGIVLTKLDGSAKGGIVFAISKELGLPIRFIGIGEQETDLIPFDKESFIKALLPSDDDSST